LTEDGALICGECASALFADPKFFLNPVLVGQSVFQRIRSEGSAATLLGPTAESSVVRLPSVDIQTRIADTSVEGMMDDEVLPFYETCNTVLAHLGVPLKFDNTPLMLSEDAASTISTVTSKVDAVDEALPGRGMTDLYLRIGVVYWHSSQGILLRTASRRWANETREHLVSKAREYFSKVLADDDLFSIAEYNLGMLSMFSEDWEGAREHLGKALERFPGDSDIVEALARANLELGNQIDAMAMIDEGLSSGERPELWVLKGRVLWQMGMANEAIECYNQALSVDGKCLEAHDCLITLLKDQGRVEEASVAERQKAMSRMPDLDQRVTDLVNELRKASAEPAPRRVRRPAPPIHEKEEVKAEPYPVELAREAMRSGNFDSAIQMAEHILAEDPASRGAQLILIESLAMTDDISRATDHVRSFYEANKDDPSAWYWRGVLAEKEGKWGAAVQYFSKAVTMDPAFLDAWLAMGETLLENKKMSGADESFSRALQINSSSSRAWLGKAKAMRDLGRWGAAIQCLDKYNMLEPRDKDSWLLKADILFEKEKHRRAVEAYDKFLELDQDDSYALGRKGIALNALGMVDDAKRCLEEAVRLDKGNREAVKWLRSLSEEGES